MPLNHIVIIAILVTFSLSGCSTLNYYVQSINGQLEILAKRQSVDSLLKDGDLPHAVLARLELTQQIREFAISELGLPDNNSYLDYADIGRDFVVWNVFATPELSLQNHQWCYLIVGCLSYRGYFSEESAQKFASDLEARGYDIFVGGVTAFSTLGWFADPILNTMLRRGDLYLARVIFHELAHQKVYIKNDTEINEAFADTVADAGMQRWINSHYQHSDDIEKFESMQLQEDQFVALVLKYRNLLDDVYQSSMTDAQKRMQKSALLEQMVLEYQEMNSSNKDHRYDAWFATGLNNAKLTAVVTYRKYMPGFKKMLQAVNDNLDTFYHLAEQLRYCTPEQRRDILLNGNTGFSCKSG